jgi:ABC-2 type transport system permease protein
MFPIAFILSFFSLNGSPQVLAGIVTMYIALGSLTSTSQSVAFMKFSGQLTLLFTTKTERWMIALSHALVQLTVSLPVALVLIYLSSMIHKIIIFWPVVLLTFIIGWIYNFLLALSMGLAFNMRLVNQLSQVLGWTFSFLAPTFVPLSVVPYYLRPLTFLEPSTFVAQQLAMSFEGSFSPLYFLGMIVYLMASLYLYRFVESRLT